ncbi:MAG: STAS domain-containing protein [Ignavibacteriaceae bacterium]
MDFLVEEIGALVIITVNLKRATFFESSSFRDLLNNYFAGGYIKFIVDLSQCEYIDAAFLSNLIIFLRTVFSKGGNLRIVNPELGTGLVFDKHSSLRVFELFDSREDAVRSFKKGLRITLFTEPDYINKNLVSDF